MGKNSKIGRIVHTFSSEDGFCDKVTKFKMYFFQIFIIGHHNNIQPYNVSMYGLIYDYLKNNLVAFINVIQ